MWTNVSKPTSSVWSMKNFQGKEQYDDPAVQYDDSNTFYDGVNESSWTDVSKPTSSVWSKVNKPT